MSTRTQYFKLRGGILNGWCKKVLIASALFAAASVQKGSNFTRDVTTTGACCIV